MIVSGSGTLRFKCKINQDLYSNEKGCNISNGALVWSEASTPFSTSTSYYFWMTFYGQNARYRYKGTVAGAEKLFETKKKDAMNFVNKYDTANYQLAARALDGDLEGYVEVYLTPIGAPKIESAELTHDAEGALAVTFVNGKSAVGYSVLAKTGAGETVEIPLAAEVAGGANPTLAIDLSALAPDTTYELTLKAFKNDLAVTQKLDSIYTGTPTLVKTGDANELGLVAGGFTVSRGDASSLPLTVNLAYASVNGAVGGQTYAVPPTTVTIPAGETTVSVEVAPLNDAAVEEDVSVTVGLADGYYAADAEMTAEIEIKNITVPENTAVWYAKDAANLLASDPANWYGGRLPTESDAIMLNSAFSAQNIVWDGGVDGLPTRVASWHQQGWNGTVTIPTTYEGDFTTFTVTGDVLLDNGTWTSPVNGTAETYILNVSVGGNLSVGANGAISVQGKGYAPGGHPDGSVTGAHAAAYSGNPAHVYGDVKAPVRCGSGGDVNAASYGGGAMKLTVAGAVVIDGKLDAQSSSQATAASPRPEKGVGAGGSIFVTAASISGAGTVVASAYESNGTSYSTEAGSGGRIALVATAGEVSIPLAKLRASGSRGINAVGGGTVFVKNAADENGALYLRETETYTQFDYKQHWPSQETVTVIPAGETWTFDRVVFHGNGILAIPEGTTLTLPNGYASVSALSPAGNPNCGLLYRGGTITVPETAEHRLGGGWLFQAATPYAFPKGNVTLADYAGLGCFRLMAKSLEAQPSCTVSVDGDLTIPSGCGLIGEGRGYRATDTPPGKGAHGGVAAGFLGEAFDSILNPTLCGASCGTGDGGANNNMSGAAITVNVAGTFTLNGTANVKSIQTNWSAPRAGSGTLNITAGRLVGSGSFSADGLRTENRDGLSGAGGRIAIRLTEKDATFETFTGSITADSASNVASLAASAGTVYLQTGMESEGAGRILVRSTNNINVPTPIPSLLKGGENDVLKQAKLELQSYGRVQLAANVKMSELSVGANAKLDLNGKTLTVRKAFVNGSKLATGTYTKDSADVSGFVTGEGSLVVTSGLLVLFLK